MSFVGTAGKFVAIDLEIASKRASKFALSGKPKKEILRYESFGFPPGPEPPDSKGTTLFSGDHKLCFIKGPQTKY